MIEYIIRRVAGIIPTLFITTTIIFFSIRVIPGNPAIAILGNEASAEAIAALQERMGLNEPLYQQYISFWVNLFHGNLGRSLITNRPIIKDFLVVLPYTVDLVVAAITVGIIFGIPLGIVAAIKRNTFIDVIIRVISLLGLSFPSFYVGVMFLILFSVDLGWFPVYGGGDLSNPISRLYHLFLPALTLALLMITYVVRMTRTSVLEQFHEDYTTTARSKGLTERHILFKHILKNAMIPIVTLIGLYTGVLLGGAVLVEVVFNRPGLGGMLVGAVHHRDYTQLQSLLTLFVVIIALVNLAVDISYSFFDPRIKYG